MSACSHGYMHEALCDSLVILAAVSASADLQIFSSVYVLACSTGVGEEHLPPLGCSCSWCLSLTTEVKRALMFNKSFPLSQFKCIFILPGNELSERLVTSEATLSSCPHSCITDRKIARMFR